MDATIIRQNHRQLRDILLMDVTADHNSQREQNRKKGYHTPVHRGTGRAISSPVIIISMAEDVEEKAEQKPKIENGTGNTFWV